MRTFCQPEPLLAVLALQASWRYGCSGGRVTEEERLALAVPPKVRDVCAKLTAAGFQAVTVGGAVRDALMGRKPADWDVASAATPDQVMVLFPRHAPTGIEHGTVMVLTGGREEDKVEVTTFRGEGAYSDARRPDSVVFGVPLVEDLARRDLTVNAIAYDPARSEIIDPFGGRADLAAKILRAVGKAVERFTEDGLRVMRAVRFAAQLEFTLDPATEAGITPALPSLAKVSRERVCIELRKILAAREPSRALAIAQRTGIVASILPDVHPDAGWLGRIDRAVPRARFAALLVPLAGAYAPHRLDRGVIRVAVAILRALKTSNVEADLAGQLIGAWHACREPSWTAAQVRHLLAELDRDKRAAAIELWAAEDPNNTVLLELAKVAVTEPLGIGDLAVGGKELMAALQIPAGPVVGRLLALLLDRVLDDPALNTRERLLEIAQRLELEAGR